MEGRAVLSIGAVIPSGNCDNISRPVRRRPDGSPWLGFTRFRVGDRGGLSPKGGRVNAYRRVADGPKRQRGNLRGKNPP